MPPVLLRELRLLRGSIRTRWDELLHSEPITTPLALPDALVHLIEPTLEEVFTALENPVCPTFVATRRHAASGCSCGRNPYLAYCSAAGQALREGLVLAQIAIAPLDPVERDAALTELEAVLAYVSHREMEAFCSVCAFRLATSTAPSVTTPSPENKPLSAPSVGTRSPIDHVHFRSNKSAAPRAS